METKVGAGRRPNDGTERLQIESLQSLIRTLRSLGVPESRIAALFPGHPLGRNLASINAVTLVNGRRSDASRSGRARAQEVAGQFPSNQQEGGREAKGSTPQPSSAVRARQLRDADNDELTAAILRMTAGLIDDLLERRRRRQERGMVRSFGLKPPR